VPASDSDLCEVVKWLKQPQVNWVYQRDTYADIISLESLQKRWMAWVVRPDMQIATWNSHPVDPHRTARETY